MQRHANGTSLEVAVSFHPKHRVQTIRLEHKRKVAELDQSVRVYLFLLLLSSLFLRIKVTGLTVERKQDCYGSVIWEIILMWSSSK